MENFSKTNLLVSAGADSSQPVLVRRPVRPSIQPTPYYDTEISQSESPDALGRYWHIFKRHKVAIALLSIAGAILAVLSGLAMPAYYRAHAQIEVLSLNNNILNTKESSAATADDFETSEVETQARILQNANLQDSVFDKLVPSAKAEPSTKELLRAPSNGWQMMFQKKKTAGVAATPEELLYVAAFKSLKVKPAPKTRLVDITADSRNPVISANVVNGLVKGFIEQNIEARMKSGRDTNKWLETELDDARKNLIASEDALQAYSRKSGLIFTDDSESNIATEKLQQIQSQLAAATADRITKQARFELAQNTPADSLPDVLSDESLRSAWLRLVDLRKNVADLSSVYDNYEKLNRAKAELASVENSYEHTKSDILVKVNNDYHEALRKEKLLTGEYSGQSVEVTSQGDKSVQYDILKRDVESSRQLYDTMLQQLKASSIAAALGASNVRVVEAAEPSSRPWWPSFPILGVLGFALGGALSLVTFVIRENADRTVQNPGDVSNWIKLLELGIIPRTNSASRSQKKRLVYGRSSVPAVNTLPGAGPRVLLPVVTDALSLEAFRSTTTSILFNRDGLGQSGVLVVTSGQAAEGKTTCACSLAFAMAEVKNNVLLIDADLRRPQLQRVFGLEIENGLADILRSTDVTPELTEGFIKTTSVPRLDVITAGSNSQGVANLLYSDNFENMLKILKQRYSVIIIDTPPMLHLNDARVVARLADSVILIVRAQKTTRDAVIAATEKFAADGNPILGIILNDWDRNGSPSNYYGYRADSYYSTYGLPANRN